MLSKVIQSLTVSFFFRENWWWLCQGRMGGCRGQATHTQDWMWVLSRSICKVSEIMALKIKRVLFFPFLLLFFYFFWGICFLLLSIVSYYFGKRTLSQLINSTLILKTGINSFLNIRMETLGKDYSFSSRDSFSK